MVRLPLRAAPTTYSISLTVSKLSLMNVIGDICEFDYNSRFSSPLFPFACCPVRFPIPAADSHAIAFPTLHHMESQPLGTAMFPVVILGFLQYDSDSNASCKFCPNLATDNLRVVQQVESRTQRLAAIRTRSF
uniref:Secreted protein n=1 Tax=Angiostrongylus cantonensis TaxID=6313 RepID=A0A0K0CX81_ANGCA